MRTENKDTSKNIKSNLLATVYNTIFTRQFEGEIKFILQNNNSHRNNTEFAQLKRLSMRAPGSG